MKSLPSAVTFSAAPVKMLRRVNNPFRAQPKRMAGELENVRAKDAVRAGGADVNLASN